MTVPSTAPQTSNGAPFTAPFECDFDPATDNSVKFELNEDNAGGGMENVHKGEVGINERVVSDDNGSLFWQSGFDFGCIGCVPNHGKICGKKGLPGQEEGGVELSKDERKRLGLREGTLE